MVSDFAQTLFLVPWEEGPSNTHTVSVHIHNTIPSLSINLVLSSSTAFGRQNFFFLTHHDFFLLSWLESFYTSCFVLLLIMDAVFGTIVHCDG